MRTVNYKVEQVGIANQYYPIMLFQLATTRDGSMLPNVIMRGVTLYASFVVFRFDYIPDDSVNVCLSGNFYAFLN